MQFTTITFMQGKHAMRCTATWAKQRNQKYAPGASDLLRALLDALLALVGGHLPGVMFLSGQACTQADRQPGRQPNRQNDRQAERQTSRRANEQADKQASQALWVMWVLYALWVLWVGPMGLLVLCDIWVVSVLWALWALHGSGVSFVSHVGPLHKHACTFATHGPCIAS